MTSDEVRTGSTGSIIAYPALILNKNQGSVDWVDWIESRCKARKKFRHVTISKFKIIETREYKNINIHWIPGGKNPADIFMRKIRILHITKGK